MSWEMLGQVSTPGARTQGLLGPWSEVPLVNDPADITQAQRASEPQLRGASASACSVEDPRAGPGVPRESSVRRRRRKKGNLRRWCPSCVRPRVVPMEDHEDLAREPSSEDVPGIYMVDKATQTKSDKEHQEDVPGQTSSEEATGVHMMRVDPATLAKNPQEDLAAEHPCEAPVERVLSVINAETFTETNGDLDDLEEDVPEQTSSEEASGVHMMRVDPATLAKIPPGHLQAWSSDSEDEEVPEDVERSSGVTEKERDEDLLCEHPLEILSEMLLGSFEKSIDVETEDPQEDLAAEHPHETPVERVLSVINAETFTETNGDLDDLEEDVPEQTSSEEASGVHMMRVDPATLAKIPPGHLQAWSSDSEDEEDPEDVERSSGVTEKERDEDLCEHPLEILSEMLLGSFEKSIDVETEDPQEDLAADYLSEAPVERVLSVINAETFTETNGDLDDLEEDVPEQISSEEASGVHMMRVDPTTLAKIPPGHLQAWSSDSEDEEDPEDVERSSGVTEKELEDSTMTGSRQQMSASSSSAPAEEATEKTKVEEEVKTSKKTRKPRKKTWRNVLSRWDIFNIF
ncbi:uncharacterized protein [Macaca fascicularis]|uniref:uncharacterized protein n=1 Tax=Macaca fascicularis TaxID=9541 RepID=UPI0032B0693A